MTLEDYLPQIQLLTLQNYNNTIIAYAAYVRFGKKRSQTIAGRRSEKRSGSS